MKTPTLVARILLGVTFLVFGLNGFLHFIPQGPMPGGLAGQFLNVLFASHYYVPIFALQAACGFLFLIGRYVPLAITLIAPVIVNILLFHALMQPSGIVLGAVAAVLWFVVAYSVRPAFAGILRSSVPG